MVKDTQKGTNGQLNIYGAILSLILRKFRNLLKSENLKIPNLKCISASYINSLRLIRVT